jgi:hypothetical protein
MTIKSSMLAAAMLTAAAIAVATPAAAKSCVMAGGEATMITGDLARFMANAALGNSIKGKGLTAVGPVKMKCNDPSPLVYCIATQKACK